MGETDTEQLEVIAHYANGAEQDVTAAADYSSDDENVATVNSSGLVTAVATGSAIITAEYEGETDTCAVTVS